MDNYALCGSDCAPFPLGDPSERYTVLIVPGGEGLGYLRPENLDQNNAVPGHNRPWAPRAFERGFWRLSRCQQWIRAYRARKRRHGFEPMPCYVFPMGSGLPTESLGV